VINESRAPYHRAEESFGGRGEVSPEEKKKRDRGHFRIRGGIQTRGGKACSFHDRILASGARGNFEFHCFRKKAVLGAGEKESPYSARISGKGAWGQRGGGRTLGKGMITYPESESRLVRGGM